MYIIVTLKYKAVIKHISLYYTLRFYFPCLSLLAQPVIIFVYGPASYLHYFRLKI